MNTPSILSIFLLVSLLACGSYAHTIGNDPIPIRIPSTPFIEMQKNVSMRRSDFAIDALSSEYSSPLFSGTIRGVITASYVLNESVSGDLDSNLHPTYFRTFNTQTYAKDYFAKRSAVMALAAATHMDSACHVYQEPCTSITDFNATQYTFLPLVVINVTNSVFGGVGNPDYGLSVADLKAWERVHGRIPRRAFVVMLSGWSNRIYNEALYFNRDANGNKHFPGFSNAAIDWLLEHRPWINGIGVDTSSVDIAVNFSFHVHYAINGVTKVSVENLNLSNRNIPVAGAHISVIPTLYGGAPEATTNAVIYV